MKIFYFTLLLVTILSGLLQSCKTNSTEPTETTAYKDIMELHDVAMAEMGTIYELKQKIRLRLEEVDMSDSLQQEYASALVDLEAADAGMMDWMGEFRVPDQASQEMLDSFFAEQKVLVKKVNEDIFAAIQEAKQLVKDNPN